MSPDSFLAKLLRLLWGLLPWLLVAGVVFLVVDFSGRLAVEKKRIEEEKRASQKNVPAVRVIVQRLVPHRLEDKLSLPATVSPYEDVVVKAEVTGQVKEELVAEGQMARKGQVLVRLDDRDYKVKVAQIQANLTYASREAQRIGALAERRVTAVKELERIEADRKALEAQLNTAKLALERTTILSPIAGRLNRLEARKGDFVNIGTAVAQVLNIRQVKIKVGVPESDVAAVFDLKKARIVIDALGKLVVTGEKTFLSRQPSTFARLYDLELKVDNPDGRILPGMFARVELVKAVFDQTLTVPLYAVINQNDEQFVFVEGNGRARKRSVKLGVLDGWQVQVVQGLNPGDKVVIVGHRLLDDDQAVEVLKTVTDPADVFKS